MRSNAKIRKIHLKDCSFTKKGVKYSYFAMAETNKVGGKNQKNILKYLGPLTEAQAESYRYVLKAINGGKASIVDIDDLYCSIWRCSKILWLMSDFDLVTDDMFVFGMADKSPFPRCQSTIATIF